MTPPPPPTARRALRLAAALLFAVVATLITLIAGGAFDPRPAGPLVRSVQPGPLSLDGRGEMAAAQSLPWTAPPTHFSVRLTAAHVAGETDSAYGLALGDGATLTAAVSPLGEAAVWETPGEGGAPVYRLPWQPWPHVRRGAAANELWLDVAREGDQAHVTVRVNRELLWQGDVALADAGVALWLRSFGGQVTVDFQTLDWFAQTEEETTDYTDFTD